jgi:hypothetical protein
MVTDLSNEISLCTEWDHTKLRSPAQPHTPIPVELPDEIPVALAMPIVDMKRGTYGEFKSTLGKLNHVVYIIPLARHFPTNSAFAFTTAVTKTSE